MNNPLRMITSSAAPTAAGYYSHAIVHGPLVYLSGQLPIDPEHGPIVPGEPLLSIEDQVRQVLRNIEAVLRDAGSTPELIIRCTVYVSDVALWPRVNQAYAEFFAAHGGHRPARTVVPTGELHYGYQIEIDAIAVLKARDSEEGS